METAYLIGWLATLGVGAFAWVITVVRFIDRNG